MWLTRGRWKSVLHRAMPALYNEAAREPASGRFLQLRPIALIRGVDSNLLARRGVRAGTRFMTVAPAWLVMAHGGMMLH
jgi:hypothetical protein